MDETKNFHSIRLDEEKDTNGLSIKKRPVTFTGRFETVLNVKINVFYQ